MANDDQSPPRKETWQDWLPPSGSYERDLPVESLITRDELLRMLRPIRKGDPEITERTLQHWEAEGILPGPTRHWHKGATRALYPRWVVALALVAMKSRAQGRSLADIRSRTRREMKLLFQGREIYDWPGMETTLPAVLNELADHFASVMGVRPTRVELTLRDKDHESLDTYYVELPPPQN